MIQEYIIAGTPKDDFQKRLKAVLVPNTSNPTAPVQSTPQNAAANTTSPPADTSNVPPASNPPAQPDRHTRPQAQDTERRNRESIRAGKRPVEASQESESVADRSKRDLQEWREQQRKLEQQRKEERERIRNQIKQDREERKRREAEEKARATHGVTQASGSSPAKPQQYRLQVRLFDGSSVRTSFPPSATVRGDVRPWLDEQRSDGNQPYTLKHVLTPLPSHTISVAEEERTLEELGLGPTANLVMVPVHSYTEAYSSSSSSSLPVRAISAGYSLVSAVVGTVAGLVGSFLGYGPAGTTSAASSSNTPVSSSNNNNSSQQLVNNTKPPRPAAASSRGINIRTLRDQREEHDNNQFYNGNQVITPFPSPFSIHHLSSVY